MFSLNEAITITTVAEYYNRGMNSDEIIQKLFCEYSMNNANISFLAVQAQVENALITIMRK